MDFYRVGPRLTGPRPSWSYITVGNYTSDGGHLVTGRHGGFLDTRVYRSGRGPNAVAELDHLKYYIRANEPARVPPGGQLVLEWKATVETFRTCQNPFGRALTLPTDPRLACGGFVAYDAASGLAFNYLLTSDCVYVVYQRDPYRRLARGAPYAAFTYTIPVRRRRAVDLHRLRVVVDDAQKEVRWYVDYRLVFRLRHVGHRLPRSTYMTQDYGGRDESVFPAAIEYGFGSFTFLDHYPVCQRSRPDARCRYPATRVGLVRLGTVLSQFNPVLGAPTPARFYDVAGDAGSRLWGQGSETRLYRLVVYQVPCPRA